MKRYLLIYGQKILIIYDGGPFPPSPCKQGNSVNNNKRGRNVNTTPCKQGNSVNNNKGGRNVNTTYVMLRFFYAKSGSQSLSVNVLRGVMDTQQDMAVPVRI